MMQMATMPMTMQEIFPMKVHLVQNHRLCMNCGLSMSMALVAERLQNYSPTMREVG